MSTHTGITATPRPRRTASSSSGATPVPTPTVLPSMSSPSASLDDDVPGLQAVVNSATVQKHLAAQSINDVLTSLEQASHFSGDIEANFSSILDKVTALSKEVTTMADSVVAAGKDSGMGSGSQGFPEASGTPVTPSYQHFGSEQTQTPMGGIPNNYDEAKATGQSLGEIGKLASSRAAQFLSEHIPDSSNEDRYSQDSAGRWHENATGKFVSEAQALAKVPGIRRVAGALAGKAAGALRALGAGEGMSGALGAVTKFAGPIGLAVGAVTGAVNFAESQRSANNTYVQALGTSQGGAFMQRGEEWLHGLSGIGTMGMGAARDQFQQVTKLGLTGTARDQGLAFTRDLYMKYGMATEQSVGLLATATQSGTTSLDALRKGLEAVSTSAADAGINVSDAQKKWADMLITVSKSVTSEGDKGSVITTGIAKLGTSFAKTPLAGLDVSSVLNNQNVMMAASTLGVNPTHLMNQVISGKPGAVNKVLDTTIKQRFVDAVLTKEQKAFAWDWIKKNVGNTPISTSQANALGSLMGLDPYAVQQIYSQILPGVPIDLPAIYLFLFSALTGLVRVDLPTPVKASTKTSSQDTAAATGKPDSIWSGEGYTTPTFNADGTYNKNSLNTKVAYTADGIPLTLPPTAGAQTAIGEYQKSGVTNTQAEGLVSAANYAKSSGQTFLVHDKSGKPIHVSLEDLFANPDYISQIRGSTSTFATDGSKDSGTVGDLTGLSGSGVVPGSSSVPSAASSLKPVVDTLKTLAKTKGQFQISTTTHFDKFFTVTPKQQGGVTTAQRSGVPASPDSPPDSPGKYSAAGN